MKQFWDNIRVGTPSFCLMKLVLVRKNGQSLKKIADLRKFVFGNII